MPGPSSDTAIVRRPSAVAFTSILDVDAIGRHDERRDRRGRDRRGERRREGARAQRQREHGITQTLPRRSEALQRLYITPRCPKRYSRGTNRNIYIAVTTCVAAM